MKRLVPAVVLIAFVAATAFGAPADDARIAAARAEAEAGRDGAAEATLREFAAEGTSHDDRAAAAKAALEILPYARGNAVAGDLVLSVLRSDRSHPDAWQIGYGLRRRVIDGLDLEQGEPFLRQMVEIYPDYARFKIALADLLYSAGRPAEAEAVYEQVVREVPDNVRARYTLALLRELDGDADTSLAIYDDIIERDLDLWAHRYKVKLLWDVKANYDAAETALRTAFAALDAAPPGRVRDEIRAQLEWDEKLLEGRREERVKLMEADARTNRLVATLLGGWVVALGGGVLLLRRRRLL